MADTDLISFLVNETLRLQKDERDHLSSLELKLKDYSLSYLRGFFIPQFQILRFKTELGAIDVPINWSVFSVSEHQEAIIIDADEDKDALFMIFQKNWQPEMKKLLITHADGYCYLIGLKEGEDVHLHDLLNPQEWLSVA